MGSGTFDAGAYASFSRSTVGKSTDEIYGSRRMDKSLDPKGVSMRESRDSADNPKSTPLIIALDVTGSMGILADVIAREGLGTLFRGIFDRKPISDPHVMFMGVGDANCDQAPLQVSQFEADNRIVEQITKMWLEHGGGGNNFESYNLPWYFAAYHTDLDSMIKRAKRGYLFTVGDEEAPADLTPSQIERFIGDKQTAPLNTKALLEAAQRQYDVYHIVVLEGDYARRAKDRALDTWRSLLGQKVIPLADHKKLAETIISAIEVVEGGNAHDSAMGWGAAAFPSIHAAVKDLPKGTTRKMIGGPAA